MSTITEAAPEFALEVARALSLEGEEGASSLVAAATIERYTFDGDAAYIYVSQAATPNSGPALVVRTIPFAAPYWFNVDLTHEGRIFGIEILGRPDVVHQLRTTRTL